MFSSRSKTWTFPHLKTPAGPAEVYLAVEEEEEEAVSFGSPFRGVRTRVQVRTDSNLNLFLKKEIEKEKKRVFVCISGAG